MKILEKRKKRLFDNNNNTKWLDFSNVTWIKHQFANNDQFLISEYTLTTANDAPERDPLNWEFSGSNDNSNWTILDSRSDIDFPERYYTKTFIFPNDTEYEFYKFDFENNTGNIFQIAEIELIDYAYYNSIDDENNLPKNYKIVSKLSKPF